MNKVSEQYEAYPYPTRDPKDEKKRLITGSPSHPLEIDHFVFGGARDWSRPIRILCAGGGTGDALIQMAQVLTSARRPYEITYVDLSKAARAIAEERGRVRGLEGIRFITGSLLNAPDFGVFDYIDCCGVLHHLLKPQAGFDALARALAPGGGMGLMVYAPYGRHGVYPLQEAFGALLGDLPPQEKLATARKIYNSLPSAHPIKRNVQVSDHEVSDAGFYDLLLHAQDRPYTIRQLVVTLDAAGLGLISPTQPALYDPSDLLGDVPVPSDPVAAMELAEKLRGTMRMHVVYAAHKDRADAALADPMNTVQIPHLKGVSGPALAREVAAKGAIRLKLESGKSVLPVPKAAAGMLALIDGKTRLQDIQTRAGLDPIAFRSVWGPTAKALCGQGLLLFSNLLRRG